MKNAKLKTKKLIDSFCLVFNFDFLLDDARVVELADTPS
jgi:hypothetical protein